MTGAAFARSTDQPEPSASRPPSPSATSVPTVGDRFLDRVLADARQFEAISNPLGERRFAAAGQACDDHCQPGETVPKNRA
jgi:hypothetical protein